MIIDCISDLHGCKPVLQGGDLLIVAGDLTARDTTSQFIDFYDWLDDQKYKFKIYIGGNHDGILFCKPHEGSRLGNIQYLCDSECEFEGYKIWGSPWTPTFYDWHFMKDRGAPIREKWDLIPEDTDILITHGPPYGILDQVTISSRGRGQEKFAGCEELREALFRIKPKLHVFGHIHSQGGKKVDLVSSICVNAAIMDEDYNPVNKPVRIIL